MNLTGSCGSKVSHAIIMIDLLADHVQVEVRLDIERRSAPWKLPW